jgi:hypothetical protein
MKTPRILRHGIATLLGLAAAAQAEPLTWDIEPGAAGVGDGFITGGAGTWNLTNGNWTPDFGANNVAWVNKVDRMTRCLAELAEWSGSGLESRWEM